MGARLGKHFLKDASVADRIVAAADLPPGGEVLEIGPGRGILTERLLAAGAKVTAVELDARLFEELKSRFKDEPRLRLVHADFLELPWTELAAPARVAANLPYAVAAPILQKLLLGPPWGAAVLMFQKEVADRLLAEPGTRAYGLLTISARLRAKVERVLDVPRQRFSPQPRVDSAVVRLERGPDPQWPPGLDEQRFWAVVRGAFSQRRKRAAKAMAHALGLPRGKAEEALAAAGLEAGVRAEDIPPEAFIDVAASLAV